MAFITGNHFQMFGEHEYVVLHWNDGWRTWLLVWLYIVLLFDSLLGCFCLKSKSMFMIHYSITQMYQTKAEDGTWPCSKDIVNGDQVLLSYWLFEGGVWYRVVHWTSGWRSFKSDVQLSALVNPVTGRHEPDWTALSTLMRHFT